MDSDDDDFEDASSEVMLLEEDDDWMIGSSKSSSGGKGSAIGRRLQPLIPDDYGDETMAGIKFSEEFVNRYGRPHPTFFPGSLDDAITESCMKSPKERKMLAVYLHHDSSVLTNVFCAQALCAESVVSFLNENFDVDAVLAYRERRVLARSRRSPMLSAQLRAESGSSHTCGSRWSPIRSRTPTRCWMLGSAHTSAIAMPAGMAAWARSDWTIRDRSCRFVGAWGTSTASISRPV